MASIIASGTESNTGEVKLVRTVKNDGATMNGAGAITVKEVRDPAYPNGGAGSTILNPYPVVRTGAVIAQAKPLPPPEEISPLPPENGEANKEPPTIQPATLPNAGFDPKVVGLALVAGLFFFIVRK